MELLIDGGLELLERPFTGRRSVGRSAVGDFDAVAALLICRATDRLARRPVVLSSSGSLGRRLTEHRTNLLPRSVGYDR